MFWGRLHPTPPQLTHAHSPTRYDSRAVKFFMATKVGRVNILRRPATVGAGPPERKKCYVPFPEHFVCFSGSYKLTPTPPQLTHAHSPTRYDNRAVKFFMATKVGRVNINILRRPATVGARPPERKNVTSRFPNISYAFQAAINFLCNLLCMDVKLYSTTALRPPM